jgi:RNA polymerase sigma-70 factor (ECF subfamily)
VAADRVRAAVRTPRTDVEAWNAALAGDGAAFAEIFDRHEQRVLERIPPSPHAPDPADLVEGGPAVQALRALSRRHQDVVALCVLQGFSTADAAAALGIAEGTVKSRPHWAKRRLAGSTSGCAPGPNIWAWTEPATVTSRRRSTRPSCRLTAAGR